MKNRGRIGSRRGRGTCGVKCTSVELSVLAQKICWYSYRPAKVLIAVVS